MSASPTWLQMIFGLYAYLIPLFLYVMWSTLALYDLGQRRELAAGEIWGWTVAIYLIPFVGPLLYLSVGGARLSKCARLIGIGGGVGMYALVLAIASALSSG